MVIGTLERALRCSDATFTLTTGLPSPPGAVRIGVVDMHRWPQSFKWVHCRKSIYCRDNNRGKRERRTNAEVVRSRIECMACYNSVSLIEIAA
jgi:hypothetical protein